MARGAEFIETSAAVKTVGEAPSLLMIFSGQGAQWARMGKEMIHGNREFRADIEKMDSILQALKCPPSWTIMGTYLQRCQHNACALANMLLLQMSS